MAKGGLPAITKGFITALEEGSQVIILKEELEARLRHLVTVLEVLQ
jgi:hypothetical protein